jgi:hypothetical protein
MERDHENMGDIDEKRVRGHGKTFMEKKVMRTERGDRWKKR